MTYGELKESSMTGARELGEKWYEVKLEKSRSCRAFGNSYVISYWNVFFLKILTFCLKNNNCILLLFLVCMQLIYIIYLCHNKPPRK